MLILSHIPDANSIENCYIANFKDEKAQINTRYAMHKVGPYSVGVHRTAAVLAFPDKVDVISRTKDEENATDQDFVVSHLCGTAKCANPRHMAVVTQKVNESHKGCKNGCRQLCPHEPKCIFVKNGIYLPCLNKDRLPVFCHCPSVCHTTLTSPRIIHAPSRIRKHRPISARIRKLRRKVLQ
jgi:hypothetical protein